MYRLLFHVTEKYDVETGGWHLAVKKRYDFSHENKKIVCLVLSM